MAIRFSSQIENFELPEASNVKKWIAEVVKRREKSVGNISYLFCDDEYMLEVNRHYLDHDTYTDIITFDYVVANLISGDIFISVDRVGENARLFGVEFERELLRVVIHGVLHLLGQGDKSDAEAAEMRRQEEEALSLWNAMFRVEQNA
jgi:rRNA maturation RNase YbeY